MHFIYHVRFFCLWIDGRNQNKIDFLFFKGFINSKIILENKIKIGSKYRDKKYIFAYIIFSEKKYYIYNRTNIDAYK